MPAKNVSKTFSDALAAAAAGPGLSPAFFEALKKAAVSPGWVRATPFAPVSKAFSDFEKENVQLKDEIRKRDAATNQTEEELVKLKAEKEKLLRRLDLQYLLSKVPVKAHAPILSDTSKLKDEFFSEELKGAFVLSIDIRKSTELMLKAKTPDGFAAFMTRLCEQLEALVHANLGVVDKFTGDGLLAFFPQFLSRQDAGYRVVACAHSAHVVFAELYETSHSAFSTVLLDVGLGIGIDFGLVKLVKVAGSLTVVGAAVVYACRMGSAPAGRTYLNQEAFEQIVGKFNNSCSLRKESHSIKDEGTVRNVLAYDVQLNGRKYQPKLPEWLVQVELDEM